MLTKRDLNSFRKIVKKIKNPKKGLEQGVFDEVVKIATMTALEIIILNSKKEVLLTWREDNFWKGWHFPGGLLRYREKFEDRLKITVKRELGVSLISTKFLFPMNYLNGARGHDVSLSFLCRIKETPKDGKFFAKMPKNIIPEHRLLWKKLKAGKVV